MSVTVEQKREQLVKANRIRLAMCEIKQLLAVGAIGLGAALEDERAFSLSAYDLLRALPWVGPKRARRTLILAQVPEKKRVRDLTLRQRRALVEQIGGAR